MIYVLDYIYLIFATKEKCGNCAVAKGVLKYVTAEYIISID